MWKTIFYEYMFAISYVRSHSFGQKCCWTKLFYIRLLYLIWNNVVVVTLCFRAVYLVTQQIAFQATFDVYSVKTFKHLIQIQMQFSLIKNKHPWTIESLYSSVAEHWSCKPGVESSILSGGSFLLFYNQSQKR